MSLAEPYLSRFHEKIVDLGECWTFRAALNSSGYCSVWDGRRPEGAHRLAYEVFVGPIPKGYDIDHTCERRWCVNPAHLRPQTTQENRGRQVTHCKRGHEFTPENTYLYTQSRGHGIFRQCKACNRIRAGRSE